MRRPIEIEKFKIYEEDVNQHNYFSKLVDERAFFEVFPNAIDFEELEPTRRKIASYARGNLISPDGTLMRVFEKNAKVVNTQHRTVTWKIFTGPGDIRGSFIRDYSVGENSLGRGGRTFEIGLDTEWFGPNDLIIFEGLREVPLLIRSNPYHDGEAWIYEVVLFTDNVGDAFPKEELTPGKRILQVGSLIGEATPRRGNVHFGDQETYVEFEVPMTHMGWEMKITDRAHRASKNYRLEPSEQIRRQHGMNTDVLYNSLEMKFMAATNKMKDLWLTYGQSAGQFSGRFLDGMTESDLGAGPSLFEFMEASYIFDFNIEAFNIDMFREFLPTLWKDKVDINDRVVDIYTGTGGLIKWQKACEKADIAGVLQTADENYTEEAGLFPGRKGFAIGAKQYRAVYIEPFGLIRVHWLPFLDSELVETRQYRGLPITSYEFIIFNYGYGDGRDSNIYILNNDEVEQYGYAIGTYSPLGPVLGRPNIHNRFLNGNSRENAYWFIHECMFGMVVKDPSYMVWFRPNFS